MSIELRETQAQRATRRTLFWYWTAATLLLALVIGIAGPVAYYFAEGRAWVAALVPVSMIALLVAGPPRAA